MKIKQFVLSLQVKKPDKKSILLMKLSFSLYLLGCLQLMAINGFSQDKVTLNLEDTQLEVILKQIEKQTSYNFIYNNDEINVSQKLTIEVIDKDLTKTLNELLQTTTIRYLIKNSFIILSNHPQQNNKYTLSGTVKDAATGETLPGASIYIKDGNKGVTTNEYGFYSITLTEGNYSFQISYMGYAQKEITLELIKNAKLDIQLESASNELDEVTITTNTENKSQVNTITSGVSTLKNSEIKQLPAFLGEPDIIRALLTLPGVNTIGEGASGINVRGGNIDQNLVLLDEAPIYNPTHVFGLFSGFNTDAIKEMKLYKGGIPARFGGRASSVLEIRQRDGNTKAFKGDGGLGLLFSRLTIEGPIKKEKLSFLVSGRRSYFDVFFPIIGGEVKDQKVFFYDVSSKLSWKINKNNTLFLSGYFGADVMKLFFEGEVIPEGKEPDGKTDFSWKNTTATLRWNHIFSNKLFMNISGIYSQYNYNLKSTDGGPLDTNSSIKWKSSLENFIVKPDFTYYLNPDTKMRFGINSTLYHFTPAKATSDDTGINTIKLETEKGVEVAPYIEYEKKWNHFSFSTGLRYSWFGNFGYNKVAVYSLGIPQNVTTIIDTLEYKKGKLIKSFTGFEPRVSLKYNLKNNKALKLGYNRMFQYIHYISNTTAAFPFDVWKLSGVHIKPLEVHQISTGYAYDTPNKHYNFTAEAYYKTFENIVEYKNGANLLLNENIETQLLPAKGYSYGTEFGAYKNTGKLKGNINYTYAVTKRKTTSIFPSDNINDSRYYPSNYDRPHVFNITTDYQLGLKWNVGLFFTYQSGRPVTKPTGRLIFDNNPYLTYSDRNAYRLPSTHRMDISFTYTPKRPNKKWEGSWSFGLYNLYARKNAFSSFSIFKNNRLRSYDFYLIGTPVPYITYNFKF